MRSFERPPPYSEPMPSHNPFAPVSTRERKAPARAPEFPPLRRLRRLGLLPDEEQVVRERWEALSDAERTETFEAMENLDNDELARQIVEMRQELAAERRGQRGAEVVSGADADEAAVDVDDVPDGTVPEVLEWVGDDQARASAALLAEQRRHDPPRKTLVEPLEDLVG